MNLRLPTSLLLTLAFGGIVAAAPPIDFEIVTERGVQITAPREWLQLLTRAGIDNVRIRGARAGDEPSIANQGTPDRPSYKVVGLLTRDEQLRLKGATFGRADIGRLKDYFDRLTADGAETLTAPRGRFDLTEKEFETVFTAFSRPVDFATKDQTLLSVIDRAQAASGLRIEIDPSARESLRDSVALGEEVEGLSLGTGLAVVLWNRGLVLQPEKPRGQPVQLRIAAADADTLRASTIGEPDDKTQTFWPIGWEAEARPRELAPSLFESLNAEIDGYTLEETLAAVTPRLGIPLHVDQMALAEFEIDPAAVKIKLPRTRTYYKRVLDRVLAQARLGAQLRIDETGTPFLWATR